MAKKIGGNLGVATSLILWNAFNATLALQVYVGLFLEKIKLILYLIKILEDEINNLRNIIERKKAEVKYAFNNMKSLLENQIAPYPKIQTN